MRSDFSIKSQSDDEQEAITLHDDIDKQSFDDSIRDEYDKLFDNMQTVDSDCEEKSKKRKHVQERSLIDHDVSRFEMFFDH